jgi:hypothetical protein
MNWRTLDNSIRVCGLKKYDLSDGFYWTRDREGIDIVLVKDGEIYTFGWEVEYDGPIEIGDRIEPPNISP